MYTATQLHTLTKKPKIDEINLKLLLEYWILYLEPYEFQFTLEDEDSTVIALRFPPVHFAHLLGIETIARRGGIKGSDIKKYKGQPAYDAILADTLTFEALKSLNKTIFKSVKDKFLYFYQIPHLVIQTSEIITFTPIPGSYIECELLIYNGMHEVYVHLGLEKEGTGKFYIPRTFFVERNLGRKYIDAGTDENKKNITTVKQITL